MLKKVFLALFSTIVSIVFLYQGFDWGTESRFITESIPSAVQTSLFGAVIYICICVSMIFLGLAILLSETKSFTIDIFKSESIALQVIKPLLTGYAFGMAYISFTELFGIVITLYAGHP